MNRYVSLLFFLTINFSGIWLGAYFMGDGVTGSWYSGLNQAPWTPPGWVFGAAWTTVMICFSFLLFFLFKNTKKKKFFTILYIIAWILNVAWNPFFFEFKTTIIALIILVSLTMVVFFFFIKSIHVIGWKSLLLLPYFIWGCIATSLNAYVVLNN